MQPTNKNKRSLSRHEKQILMAQLSDYRRILRRQLHTHQELLMLHMDLIPVLADNPAYTSYVARWEELIKALQHESPTGGSDG